MKVSKIFMGFGILMVVFMAPVICVFLSMILMLVGGVMLPSPAKPEITYGEFPFTFEYEINGEIIKVEDTVICEYDGVGLNSNGKYLKWKDWIESSGEEDILIVTDGNIKIFCNVGYAEYYLGEEQYEQPFEPFFVRIEYFPEGGTSTRRAEDEELEKHKIKIISYNLSPPIKNTFKHKFLGIF